MAEIEVKFGIYLRRQLQGRLRQACRRVRPQITSFLKAIDLNKACRKSKSIDRPGIWCTGPVLQGGRSHPAATANVRGFSVRRVELRRCANGRPDNLYNLRGCALYCTFNANGPPTQFVLIGGLYVGAVHCRGGFFTHNTEVHTMQLSAPAPSLGQSGVRGPD